MKISNSKISFLKSDINSKYEILHLKASFSKFINNCYIIIDKYEREVSIVDPAWDLYAIMHILDLFNVKLKIILLTHSHFDHTNLVAPLVERFNPKVIMSRSEAEFYNFHCKNLYLVQDMDIIEFGKLHILCILTPGHTAGGMCFHLPGSIFTGDTIFIEGCGICNSIGGCPDAMYESIQKIKKTMHPDTRIYPGHSYGKKPGNTLESIMECNIYFQIENKAHFIDFRMRNGQRNLFDFK
jgi:Zn-dependent hydrolases, including glyoxylases